MICAIPCHASGRRWDGSADVEFVTRAREYSNDHAVLHPAAEQKKTAMEKFEKFSAEGIINAAASQESQRVTTKVTTVEIVN